MLFVDNLPNSCFQKASYVMFLWEYSNRNWMVLPTKKNLCVTDLMVDDNDYYQKRKIDVTKKMVIYYSKCRKIQI